MQLVSDISDRSAHLSGSLPKQLLAHATPLRTYRRLYWPELIADLGRPFFTMIRQYAPQSNRDSRSVERICQPSMLCSTYFIRAQAVL